MDPWYATTYEKNAATYETANVMMEERVTKAERLSRVARLGRKMQDLVKGVLKS